MQSYELPQQQYAFLQSVKARLGYITHAIVSVALQDGHYRISRSLLRIDGEEAIIQSLAKEHAVFLKFE